MTIDIKRTRISLLQHIEFVSQQVTQFLLDYEKFKFYKKLLEENEPIRTPSDFHQWVLINYSCNVALFVRRQLDTSRDSKSLKKVLEKLIEYPELLSREWHRSIYKRV